MEQFISDYGKYIFMFVLIRMFFGDITEWLGEPNSPKRNRLLVMICLNITIVAFTLASDWKSGLWDFKSILVALFFAVGLVWWWTASHNDKLKNKLD